MLENVTKQLSFHRKASNYELTHCVKMIYNMLKNFGQGIKHRAINYYCIASRNKKTLKIPVTQIKSLKVSSGNRSFI